MNELPGKIKKAVLSKTGILSLLIVILLAGAIHSVRVGNGFLFIPAYTATPTETPTATIEPTASNTPVPTETPTPVPTFDETAFADAFYTSVTQTADVYWLMQTPSATPVIPEQELYTGLKMINPADGKTLFYIRTSDMRGQYGFWIDWNEISNEEYRICARLELCTPPQSVVCSGMDYYSDPDFSNYPVVNITRDQASAYCAWAGMELMTVNDWRTAAEVMQTVNGNYDQLSLMPAENTSESSNIIGNVWEWTSDRNSKGAGIIAGGSWKSSVQDIKAGKTAEFDMNAVAEDLGFRCVKRISSQ